jgi:VanZ family protein
MKTVIWRWFFWACMVAAMVLALMPQTSYLPTTGWDKSNHLMAFAVLALLGCLAYPGRKMAVLLGLLAYGGLIEVLQSFTPDRFAEWGDWLADALGLLLGWGLSAMVGRR